MSLDQLLPDIFLLLMALSVLIYAVLDGYDLGVGILMPQDNVKFRNQMIASVGPFWDANETWLVLAVGILLIAFPLAHNLVLRELYLPATLMLVGLILRGVAFDFRAKAITRYQPTWDRLFQIGSLIVSLSQGFMLGLYVCGFEKSSATLMFSLLTAIGAAAAYVYIGGSWLVLKTEGQLQYFAAKKARKAGWLMGISLIAICVVNPLINSQVAERWFSLPNALLLLPIPLFCALMLVIGDQVLKRIPLLGDKACWVPFASAIALFTLCLLGFAFSYYPYVIPGKLMAQEAHAAIESLRFVFYGVIIVLPAIVVYTTLSYWIFRGKTKDLNYY